MKTLLPILTLLLSSQAFANEISLMFVRSPKIDWTSPRSLTNSTLTGGTKPYGLGHVNIRVQCGDKQAYTGIYNRYKNETTAALLRQDQGFGVLFNLFEGLLQKDKSVIERFEKLGKTGRTSFVTFKVSPEACQRAMTYHEEYWQIHNERQAVPRLKKQPVEHTQKVFYGFPAISRYGEGGGCSGFGISFLEVAGIKEQWMVDLWTSTYLAPEATVGKPMTDKDVPISYMVFSSPKRWATEDEPHFKLFFWDPDKMHDDTLARVASEKYETGVLHGAKGIIIDRTNVPVPDEPIFLRDTKNNVSDARAIYNDVEELERRYEFSKTPSFAPDSEIAKSLKN